MLSIPFLSHAANAADMGGDNVIEQAVTSHTKDPRIGTGCYVGASIGYTNTSSELSYDTVASIDSLGADGSRAGVNGGCDYRMPNSKVVLGFFGNYNWDLSDHDFSVDLGPFNFTHSEGDQWAVGARLGFTITDATMIYGLVGYTERETSASLSGPGGSIAIDVADREGYQFGGGIETMISNSASFSLEYRHTEWDNRSWMGGDLVDDATDDTVEASIKWRPSLIN